ncbi:SDR family NAD(P)-dependent oxidoreductase [Marivita hallyeonensis]|uniref:Ketoreductase domain-containing protein n=1 Tax=Marivita hallyeonensis TaxID=996342 RepID=A0A1M5QZ99_9RHOB|nr:SDR family oxidoreductase [Marivita hallyeonensis]SHH19186.1 3-oxoacyl-[acyl-carrier protein] reductase/hypothetical protein [Marivita hallyeonensis]
MKVVLVTGGARGIGRGIVEAFASDHAVSFTYNTTEPDGVLTKLRSVHAIKADLAERAAAQEIVDAVINRWGRLDVIVNNAGVVEPDDGDMARTFAVNVTAPMHLLEAALPHLKSGASVINISSMNARLPAMGAAGYSASKAALDTWTKGMAKTLGPRGIRVNAIAPGAIERTESPRPEKLVQKFVDLTALGRVGTPSDVAGVVRFLASDAAGFITGEILGVTGGYRL